MLDCDHCRPLRQELERQGGPPPKNSRQYDTRMIGRSPTADPGDCSCECHDIWRAGRRLFPAA